MKKLVSTASAILLSVIMVLSCMVTVSAETTVNTNQKGSITLKKYDSATVQKDENDKVTSGTPVQGATFSVYRILDFDNGKTYTVDSNFIDSEGNNVVEVDDIVNVSASQAGTLSYGSTTELESQITKLQNHIQTSNVAATQSGETGANGQVTLSDLPLGVYLVQETVVPAGYTVTTQAFLVAIPTWNQSASNGAGEWVYNVTATPKDELLKVDKKMKDTNQGTADGAKDDSYAIGDTIPYVVTVKIPNYGMSGDDITIKATDNLLIDTDNGTYADRIAKYNGLNLKFTDELTKGLTLDLSSLEIKVIGAGEGGADVPLAKGAVLGNLADFTLSTDGKSVESKTTVTGGKDYTAKEESVTKTTGEGESAVTTVTGTKMTIDIAWASLDQYQGKTIQLTYNAQLNENAVVGSVNQNDVTYKFTNDPQQVMGEVNSKTTTTDTDKVYTYQMNLTKIFNGVAADGTKINASTVEFELTTVVDTAGNKVTTPTPLKFIQETTNGHYTVWNGAVVGNQAYKLTDVTKNTEGTWTANEGAKAVGTVVTTLNPDKYGKLYVKGLEAGTYELKETKSLNGYTILTEPITIKVDEVKEGNPEAVTQKVTAHTMKWDATNNKAVTQDEPLANKAETGIFSITVNNAKNQFNLPITGGLGLWMFTIGGGIVMAGAIIFFSVIRKKKSNKV